MDAVRRPEADGAAEREARSGLQEMVVDTVGLGALVAERSAVPVTAARGPVGLTLAVGLGALGDTEALAVPDLLTAAVRLAADAVKLSEARALAEGLLAEAHAVWVDTLKSPPEAEPHHDAVGVAAGERDTVPEPDGDPDAAGERLAVPPVAHVVREGAAKEAVPEVVEEGEGLEEAEASRVFEGARLVPVGVPVLQKEAEALAERVAAAPLPDAPAEGVPAGASEKAGRPAVAEAGADAEAPPTGLGEARALADARDALMVRDVVADTVLLGVAERQRVAVPLPVKEPATAEGVLSGLALTEAVSPPSPPGLPLGGADALPVAARGGEGESEADCEREGGVLLVGAREAVPLAVAEGPTGVPLTVPVPPRRSEAEMVGLVDSEMDTKGLTDIVQHALVLKDGRGDLDTEGEGVPREDSEGEAVTEGELLTLGVPLPTVMLCVVDAEGVFELLTDGVVVLLDEGLTVFVKDTEGLGVPDCVLLDVVESLCPPELVLVFEEEAEPVGVRELDAEAVDVAVVVSELVTEPLAVGEADLPGLEDSRAERLPEPDVDGAPELVPLSHTSPTCPPMGVAEAKRLVGDSDGCSEAVAQGVAESVALAVPVRCAEPVGRDEEELVLVAVALAVEVGVPLPPLPETDTEADTEAQALTVRVRPALAVTDTEAETDTVWDGDADEEGVFEEVGEVEAHTVVVEDWVALMLRENAGVPVPAMDAVAFPFAPPPPGPSSDADGAGELLTLGEGVLLRDITEAVPVLEAEMVELGLAPAVPLAPAVAVLPPLREGSHTEGEGEGGVVRDRLGEGDAESEARGDPVKDTLLEAEGVRRADPVTVGEPLSVRRVEPEALTVVVRVAVRVPRDEGVHVFLSQSTVDVAVVEGDAVPVPLSLNCPMVIVGDVEMDAQTEDVGVFEEEEEPVAVSAEVAEADWEERAVTVALEDVEAVAEGEVDADARAVPVFDALVDDVCVPDCVALPSGEPLPAPAEEGVEKTEAEREDVEDLEGHAEKLSEL